MTETTHNVGDLYINSLYFGQFLNYIDPIYHFGILKVSSLSTHIDKSRILVLKIRNWYFTALFPKHKLRVSCCLESAGEISSEMPVPT